MWFRRTFLALFAPSSKPGWRGTPIAAAYDLRTRTTTIFIDTPAGTQSGTYEHDTSLISRPSPSPKPKPEPHQPAITLRIENNTLAAFSKRGKFTTLMPIPPGTSVKITYPFPVHPDLTVIWSINDTIYFTNNDYRNIYLLPGEMNLPQLKPLLLTKKSL